MSDLMLSIYVPTYNHERYIARALDGILMQKTKYSYEILVGEDCSSDRTREILKEYEKKYPGKFQMFYREKNMYHQIPSNAEDLRRRCKGKYMICLEGDDFWIDENKVEKQIDFLEHNPDYLAVAHNCVVVGEDSKPNGEKYPECKDEEYSLKHFVSEIMPGQYATFMWRNCYRDNIIDMSAIKACLSPVDRTIYFSLALNGKIKCIQETMTAYRHVKNGGTSFSATFKPDFEHDEKWNWELVKYSKKFDKQAIKYAELLYFRNLMIGIKDKQCSFRRFIQYVKKMDYIFEIICFYVKYWIRHHILRKNLWV